ncbi:MAG: hypothetical protein LLG06_01650 [Desulfobacteraceae bacterium]|nr:hypothetical protein [Desulfobacteraceae bacterium]
MRVSNFCSLTFVLALLLFFSAPCHAAWESVPLRSEAQKKAGVPGGEGMQYAMAIAYAPSNPDIVYMGVDQSQVWKSIDGGASWTHLKSEGFPSDGACSVVVDPVNPDIVFVAGFDGYDLERAKRYPNGLRGIYKSVDGGTSWRLIKRVQFYRRLGFGILLAFDSRSSKEGRTMTVLAGTSDAGLLRSVDSGETWSGVGFESQGIRDVKEDPGRPGHFFILTDGGLFRYGMDDVKRIGAGLPDSPHVIAISRQNPAVILAACGTGGMYRSDDGGMSFTISSSGLPWGANITNVVSSPVDAKRLYAKAHLTNLKPFFSENGGHSWQAASETDIGSLSLSDAHWFASPIAAHPRDPLRAIMETAGFDRVIATKDGGRTWAGSNAGYTGGRAKKFVFPKDKPDRMVFFLTDFGFWLTDDKGETFRELQAARVFRLKSSEQGAVSGNTVVADRGSYRDRALVVSQDLGKSWEYFSDKRVNGVIEFHPQDEQVVYAGRYRSRDRGKTWETLGNEVFAVWPGNGNVVYSYSKDGGGFRILKSTDQGSTWSSPFKPAPVSSVRQMVVSPDRQDLLYLASDSGACIQDGNNWSITDFKSGLERDYFGRCQVYCIAVDPNRPHLVYAGRASLGYGQGNGVFRSRDRGQHWESITDNLKPYLTVWGLGVDPKDGAVYIGTSLGTWRYRSAVKVEK